MPHFSFWAWRLPFVGAFSRVTAAVDRMETELSFDQKDPRVVWRGTLGWNSAHYPGLREKLLRVTEGAGWADVQALDGYGEVDQNGNVSTPSNALMIEDFCRYKYVLYTEVSNESMVPGS